MAETIKYEKYYIGRKVYGSLTCKGKILESWLITDLSMEPWLEKVELPKKPNQRILFATREEIMRKTLGY